MSNARSREGERQTTRTIYDPERINQEILPVCDYYLGERRKEGRRYTYRCPGCGGRRFEVEPVRGIAGCFSAGCGLPTSTDALGIISYMEDLATRGSEFVECLKKGYEILGIDDDSSPPRQSASQPGDTAGGPRPQRRAWFAGGVRADNRQPGPDPDTSSEQPDETPKGSPYPGRVVEAYTEMADGSREHIEAFVVDEEPFYELEPEENPQQTSMATSNLPARRGSAGDKPRGYGAQRLVNHRVFTELLRMCPLEERDRSFFMGRGLDEAAIRDGRFGSISKKRCRYVTGRLEEMFPDEELLAVPGFYRSAGSSGELRFSLYGDYTLIPYYDREGYILTVEGRLIGEPRSKRDKKYKALLGSGVHLYVHPRFDPEEVVAFCEGAIGAMVAARYGLPVAAIKGMRNYRQPPEGREEGYSVLAELQGVDFGGREVVYIPDLDVKPKTRAEALAEVPKACEWLIERQEGRAKVALLPREAGAEEDGPGGAKDLDEWLLSLDDKERVEKFHELLEDAIEVEEWERTEESDDRPEEQSREEGVSDEPARQEVSPPVACGSSKEVEEGHNPASASQGYKPASSGMGESFQRQSTRRNATENGSSAPAQAPAQDGKDLPNHPQTSTTQHDEVGHPAESDAGTGTRNGNPESTEEQGHSDSTGEDGGTEEGERRVPDDQRGTAPQTARRTSAMRRVSAGMERWYATRELSKEQVEQIRASTEHYEQASQAAPSRKRSAPVHVPKWNAGEVFIAIVVAVFVAGAVCMLAYLARQQEGLLGSVGEIATSIVWWIQVLLYWTVGAMVAEVVARTRHRKRRRQLRDHVRGRAG